MADPASRDDVLRLTKMVEALKGGLQSSLHDVSEHLSLIHNDIKQFVKTLEAIKELEPRDEPDYAAQTKHALDSLAEELKSSRQSLKKSLDRIDIDQQKIREYLEKKQRPRRRLYG
ncbi:MAG TPA: hypothetical protein VGA08_00650 [Candidatus Saccharimonadales bacterium]